MVNGSELEQLKFPIGNFIFLLTTSEIDINFHVLEIEKFSAKIKLLTSTLSPTELNYKYRPNGWSIKQVVHHCADSHMNAYIRTKLALTEILPVIKPYNETIWANLIDGNSDSILDSLLILEGIHSRWVLLLKNLSITDLEKEYYHPENNKNVKIKELIAFYSWHCNHHLSHIKQALNYKDKF